MFHNSFVTLHSALLLSSRIFIMLCMLPILPLYQEELMVENELWIGIAIGCYGLTQAIMQLIMGYLSDIYGRIRIIRIGLLIFTIGSIIPIFFLDIFGIIASRFIQGLGAIGAVVTAWLQEQLPLKQRPMALAVIGIFIGISFITSFSISLWVTEQYNLATLVYMIAVFSLILWLSTLFYSKDSVNKKPDFTNYKQCFSILKTRNYLLFFYIVFCLHKLFACHFCFVPTQLQALGLGSPVNYALLLFISYLCAIPLLVYFKSTSYYFYPLMIGFILVIFGYWLFYIATPWSTIGSLIIFFTGFNVLEALMPTLLTDKCSQDHKGLLLGMYYSFQYLGIFAGGLMGGLLLEWSSTLIPHIGIITIYLIATSLPLLIISSHFVKKYTLLK